MLIRWINIFLCILGLVFLPVMNRLEKQELMLEQHLIAETEWLKARVTKEGKLLQEDYDCYQRAFVRLKGIYCYDIFIARPLIFADASDEESEDFLPQYGEYEMLYKEQIERILETEGEVCAGKMFFLNIIVEKCNIPIEKKVIYYGDLFYKNKFFYTTGGEVRERGNEINAW